MRRFLVLGLGLCTFSLAAFADDITTSQAKQAVRDYLKEAGQNQVLVGNAKRDGDVIKVEGTSVNGIVLKTFKVDAKTGHVLG